ncbi:MAG: spoIIIJ-associated protein [Chloroflexota bacterium]|jgi:spoIIIJ-associated protein|nr:spoIIIJ-associated protein [Chloroflexota bacterium]
MSEYQEFTGKTVEEALRNARESFGVGGLDDLDFEILTAGSRGVLGMGAEPARIVAAPRSALGGAAPRREAAASVPLPPPPPREDRGFDRDRERTGRGFDRGRDRDRGPRDSGGGRDRVQRDMGPRDAAPREMAPREGGQDRGFGRDQSDRPPRREPEQPREAAAPEAAVEEARHEMFGATEQTVDPGFGREEGRDRGFGQDRPRAPREGDRDRDRARRPRDDRRSTGLTQRELAEVASARESVGNEREEIQAAEASPEALAAGQEILEQLITLMGYRATVAVHSGQTSKIDVTGADEAEKEALGALIGRKGERLSALQHLVNLMLSRRMGAWTRVLVDVEDYRGRRERQLTELAHRAAERVIESGTMLQLEPMPALERRWIHLALRDVAGVATQSIGEEPQRRIVILRVGGQ